MFKNTTQYLFHFVTGTTENNNMRFDLSEKYSLFLTSVKRAWDYMFVTSSTKKVSCSFPKRRVFVIVFSESQTDICGIKRLGLL